MTMAGEGRLSGELFTECAGWIWEQMAEEGFQLSGELVELILKAERELAIQADPIATIAQILADEFRLQDISTAPYALDVPLIAAVLEWEDEFLGLAGIPRGES